MSMENIDWAETKGTVLLQRLQDRLALEISRSRYCHSVGVMETAILLVERYGGNRIKAAVAGLLHDFMREKSKSELLLLAEQYRVPVSALEKNEPVLLHGPVAACALAECYGIDDEEIRQAISWHTTGCVGMSHLAGIIFVADTIEPGRDFKGVDEMRRLAEKSLRETILFILENQVAYIIGTGKVPHEQSLAAIAFEKQRTANSTFKI